MKNIKNDNEKKFNKGAKIALIAYACSNIATIPIYLVSQLGGGIIFSVLGGSLMLSIITLASIYGGGQEQGQQSYEVFSYENSKHNDKTDQNELSEYKSKQIDCISRSEKEEIER